MAILTMFEVRGDPDEIYAVEEEKVAPQATALAAQHGGLAQIVVKTDEGVLNVHLWESEEGMRKVSAQIRPVAEAAGLRAVGWRQYEVLHHRTTDDRHINTRKDCVRLGSLAELLHCLGLDRRSESPDAVRLWDADDDCGARAIHEDAAT